MLETSRELSSTPFDRYFPSWLYKTFLPNDIDFSGYTHINYAFTLVNNGSNPFWSDPGVFNGM